MLRSSYLVSRQGARLSFPILLHRLFAAHPELPASM